MSENAAPDSTERDKSKAKSPDKTHREENHPQEAQVNESPENIKQTALVTGATSGIGFITALELARQGLQVVLHARNPEKAEQVRAEIERRTGNSDLDVLLADFSSLEEVRAATDSFRDKHDRLDILVNNAGLIMGKQRQESDEGYELTITINHLAPFIFTARLLDLVGRSSDGRIINVASEAHRGASPDFGDFHMKRSYSGWKAYCNSKLYNIMFTDELARRIGVSSQPATPSPNDMPFQAGQSSGAATSSQTRDLPETGTMSQTDATTGRLSTWSLHPGAVATNFSKNSGGLTSFIFRVFRPFLRTAENGALTSVYLASEPDIPASNGSYFIDSKPASVRHRFFSADNNRKLWELSCELTGEDFLDGKGLS